jgi:hypothetical protein
MLKKQDTCFNISSSTGKGRKIVSKLRHRGAKSHWKNVNKRSDYDKKRDNAHERHYPHPIFNAILYGISCRRRRRLQMPQSQKSTRSVGYYPMDYDDWKLVQYMRSLNQKFGT